MTARDDDARRAARVLGGQLYVFSTGDPGADDVAEYLAAGWIIAADHYAEDDDRPHDVAELVRALRSQANALGWLAGELETERVTLDSLRLIEMPAGR